MIAGFGRVVLGVACALAMLACQAAPTATVALDLGALRAQSTLEGWEVSAVVLTAWNEAHYEPQMITIAPNAMDGFETEVAAGNTYFEIELRAYPAAGEAQAARAIYWGQASVALPEQQTVDLVFSVYRAGEVALKLTTLEGTLQKEALSLRLKADVPRELGMEAFVLPLQKGAHRRVVPTGDYVLEVVDDTDTALHLVSHPTFGALPDMEGSQSLRTGWAAMDWLAGTISDVSTAFGAAAGLDDGTDAPGFGNPFWGFNPFADEAGNGAAGSGGSGGFDPSTDDATETFFGSGFPNPGDLIFPKQLRDVVSVVQGARSTYVARVIHRADCDFDNPVDADGDGLGCDVDCDDANDTCGTSCVDEDGDGVCATADCDDSAFGCWADCSDEDGDGACGDSDCDVTSDTGQLCATECVRVYPDADGDGHGDPGSVYQIRCAAPENFSALNDDCDDQLGSCNTDCHADLDGDGVVDCLDGCIDVDQDGYGLTTGFGSGPACSAADCDDNNANVRPGVEDFCDGVDNDCDPTTDDGFSEPNYGEACDGPDTDWCSDGAIKCDPASLTMQCEDSTNDHLELCDGIDNDCNSLTFDGSGEPSYGQACDGLDTDLCVEGFVDCSGGVLFCTDMTAHTPDLCDGVDNDCNPATADGSEDGVVGMACDGADADACQEGQYECVSGSYSCSDATGDSLEDAAAGNCGDGVDNDCDSYFDTTDDGCWSWDPLTAMNLQLRAIDFVNTLTGYVVGNDGTILKTTDGGTTWFQQTSSSGQHLRDVHFATNANVGYVVGNSGKVLKTTDGGASWYAKASGISGTLHGVHFMNEDVVGYAVGDAGTILKSTDGGVTWDGQTSGTAVTLRAVTFPSSASVGYVVGDTGTLLKTTDGGVTWVAQTSGTSENLYAVAFPSGESVGYVAGTGGDILKTANGGTSWTAQSSGTAANLEGLYFVSSTEGYASGGGGTLLKTSDGGSTWLSQTSGVGSTLRDVAFPVDSTGFVIGSSSTIIKTVNSSVSWTSYSTGDDISALGIQTTHFVTNAVGWIGAVGGRIFRTDNGGLVWSEQTVPTSEIIYDVAFAGGALDGLAVGANSTLVKTTDGGTTWIGLTPPTTSMDMRGIYRTSTNTAFVVGDNGNIWSTINGGSTWTSLTSGTSENLHDVSFPESVMRGYVVGDNGLCLRTVIGGVTWTAQTTGVGENLRGVDFPVDNDTGYIVGDNGTILKSTDGGTTWTALTSGTSEDLLTVDFPVDNTIGYVVGNNGIVLKTTDGGANWVQEETGVSHGLRGVHFPEDATQGYVVGGSGTFLRRPGT